MSESKTKNMPIPKHVGIVISGQKRWSGERNLPAFDGHKKGMELVKQVPLWFFESGVPIVTLSIFQSQNWSMASEEVNCIMKLIQELLEDGLNDFVLSDVKIIVSGRVSELPGNLPQICADAEMKTKNCKKGILNLCLNYGGRNEILDCVKKIINNSIGIDQVHEGMIKKYLYYGELPDPDIIVRMSGDKHLTGLLLWQSANSQQYFMEKFWPEFEKTDIEAIISTYGYTSLRKQKG